MTSTPRLVELAERIERAGSQLVDFLERIEVAVGDAVAIDGHEVIFDPEPGIVDEPGDDEGTIEPTLVEDAPPRISGVLVLALVATVAAFVFALRRARAAR